MPDITARASVLHSSPRPGLLAPEHWLGASVLTQAERAALMALLPVRYQAQTDMCMAEASAELRQLWDIYLKTANPPGEYSAPYIYAKGHQIAGNYAEGMEATWALDCLQQYGACPQSLDPINSPTENVSASIAALTAAMDTAAAPHKISAYGPVPISGTVRDSYAALTTAIDHFPILVALPVANGSSLFTPAADGHGGFVCQWQPGAMVAGGHAMLAWDYRMFQPTPGATAEPQIRVRNSWGAGYGQGGDVWLGGTYLLWEAWSVTCATVNPLCASLNQFLVQYGKSMPADQIAALQTYMKEKGCA